MLFCPGLSRFSFTYDNIGANPNNTSTGVSVVPGASNVEGSWTALASSGNIAQDCYWIRIDVTNGATSAAIKDHLLDIGVDPAGGTSYTSIIPDILCGDSSNISAGAGGGHSFLFPFFIKAGSSLAARIQGSAATAGTVRVSTKLYGQPSRPEAVPVGAFSETIGTITNTQGVSFTPGNATDGAWTTLGTTAKAMWWWNLGVQVSNAAVTARYTWVDLAFGDASNKLLIMRHLIAGTAVEQNGDSLKSNLNPFEAYCPVPAGATIYVRGRANAAPDSGYNALAIGIGG